MKPEEKVLKLSDLTIVLDDPRLREDAFVYVSCRLINTYQSNQLMHSSLGRAEVDENGDLRLS